jgi:hypothetical protein
LTRDTTIYACNLYNQYRQLITQVIWIARTQEGKPNN